MILIESRLTEALKTLPNIKAGDNDLVVQFSFGTERQIQPYLDNKKNSDTDAQLYPLIWLSPSYSKTNAETNRVTTDVTFLILMPSNPKESNENRLQHSFKSILNTVYKNLINCLDCSGFTRIINRSEMSTYDFYEKKAVSTSLWDAIKIEMKLEVTNNKLKTIYY